MLRFSHFGGRSLLLQRLLRVLPALTVGSRSRAGERGPTAAEARGSWTH